ncbi:MAG: linear amide C-N hydrolase [Hyphomicrobiaceae bacterium]
MRTLVVGTALVASLVAEVASACSFLNFKHNGGMYIGRTNELPFETDEQLIVVPRNHTFHDVSVKYGFVGINHGNDPFVSSGLNEHGLNIEGLGYGSEGFAPKGSGGISMLNVPTIVLGNARNVDEAVKLLRGLKVEADNMTQFGDVPIGFHFSITDNEKSVVVEWDEGDGSPNIYENAYGVMTNTPTYPEQLALAEKMAARIPTNPEDYEGTFFGFDRTPEGRFQQIFATNALRDLSRIKTSRDAVNHTWAAVNSLEIPQGTLYWRFLSNEPQMTAYAVVLDLKNKVYYLRTHDNQDIRMVDLKRINFTTTNFQAKPIYRDSTPYRTFNFSMR